MGAVSQIQERRRLVYTGHVQGVGFRYTTRTIARGYDVAGYVRNLPSGKVELVAEGSAEELDRFQSELDDRMSGQIRDVQVDRQTVASEFASFDIRY